MLYVKAIGDGGRTWERTIFDGVYKISSVIFEDIHSGEMITAKLK